MNREDLAFGLDALPPGIEPWSVVALLGIWWGAELVAPFRSFLAIFSVLLLLLALPAGWRARAALALWSMTFLSGLFVGRFWSQATGVTDDNRIVIDEIAGLLVALSPVINRHIASCRLAPFSSARSTSSSLGRSPCLRTSRFHGASGSLLTTSPPGWSSPACSPAAALAANAPIGPAPNSDRPNRRQAG